MTCELVVYPMQHLPLNSRPWPKHATLSTLRPFCRNRHGELTAGVELGLDAGYGDMTSSAAIRDDAPPEFTPDSAQRPATGLVSDMIAGVSTLKAPRQGYSST